MYKDDSAYPIVEKIAIFYIFSYFNPLLISILQAYKQEKKLLLCSVASYTVTLFLLTYFYGQTGFLISIIIGNILKFSLLLFFANKNVHFKPNIKNVLPLLLVILLYIALNYFFKGILTLLISTLGCGLLALGLFYFLYSNNKRYSYAKMHK